MATADGKPTRLPFGQTQESRQLDISMPDIKNHTEANDPRHPDPERGARLALHRPARESAASGRWTVWALSVREFGMTAFNPLEPMSEPVRPIGNFLVKQFFFPGWDS
jgi:hypothetical protein